MYFQRKQQNNKYGGVKMGKFEKIYLELKECVEHIENAISGSEIDTDLERAEVLIKQLKSINKTIKKDEGKMKEIRIQFGVESPRGDDNLGTTPTGEIVSDFEAEKQGVPFEQGVPQNKIQEVVETQLKDDKWVTTEDNKGNTEILTKEDIPKEQGEIDKAKDDDDLNDFAKEIEATKKETKVEEKKVENWKNTFNETKTSTSTPKTTPTKKWEHKFEEVKSATATHKSKGG